MKKYERKDDMLDYTDEQKKAKLILFERLIDRLISHLRSCITVEQMLDQLDAEHRTILKPGLIAAHDDYQIFQYHQGGDLKKYVELHEQKCRIYEEASRKILVDEERVQHLYISLSNVYDTIINWFESQPVIHQTYKYYKNQLEKYDGMKESSHKNNRSTPKYTNLGKSSVHHDIRYTSNSKPEPKKEKKPVYHL